MGRGWKVLVERLWVSVWVAMLALSAACSGSDGAPGATGAQGPIGPMGPAGSQGPPGAPGQPSEAGPPGEAGAPGSLRIYGDGSSGPLNITSDTTPTSDTLQFTTCSIAGGATLTVWSGAVLRCQGTFDLEGRIAVQAGTGGADFEAFQCPSDIGTCWLLGVVPPQTGIASAAPQPAEVLHAISPSATPVGTTGSAKGGKGALSPRAILMPGPAGGGSAFRLAAGGGTLVILAQGGIIVNGSISANGGDGGSGGGVVVLASATSVAVTGTIHVHGGKGVDGLLMNSGQTPGAAGGGGGGLIRLIAPSATSAGMLDVAGGSAGNEPAGAPSTALFIGGQAGAASIGDGGNGSAVSTTGMTGATDGAVGLSIIDTGTDPSALFY